MDGEENTTSLDMEYGDSDLQRLLDAFCIDISSNQLVNILCVSNM